MQNYADGNLLASFWETGYNKSFANSSLHTTILTHTTQIYRFIVISKIKSILENNGRVYMIFVAARSNFEMRTVQLPHPP